jgi:hypothetical protein
MACSAAFPVKVERDGTCPTGAPTPMPTPPPTPVVRSFHHSFVLSINDLLLLLLLFI